MAGDDRGPQTRAELERLIAGAVRVHLPAVDEATARAIADTALRALAAGTRLGRSIGAAGRPAGRWRRRRGGWPWWAVAGATLLAAAGGTLAGLALARLVG
jgi:hypothetical protein